MEAGQRRGLAVHADRFKWLSRVPEGSLYALVTNLPYGVKGFDADQPRDRGAHRRREALAELGERYGVSWHDERIPEAMARFGIRL